MRMLVPVVKCDGCDVNIPAETRMTTLDYTPPGMKLQHFEGDLCESCQVEVDSLTEKIGGLLNQVKAKQGRPPKDDFSTRRAHVVTSDEDFSDIPSAIYTELSSSILLPERFRTCLSCDYVANTRMDLSSHAKTKHGASTTVVARRLPTRKELYDLKVKAGMI